jgi:hypothetical protein
LEAKLAAIDFVNSLLSPDTPERKRIALTRLLLPPGIDIQPPQSSCRQAWRAALAALRLNPDAALP